jgi:excisionase family DNA binding protein
MKPTTNRPTTNRRVAGALLTKPEAAAALNVTGRFVERLTAERRVRFVKLGRHVRIPESAIAELVDAGTVEASRVERRW